MYNNNNNNNNKRLLIQDNLYFLVQYTKCGIARLVFDTVLHNTHLMQCF